MAYATKVGKHVRAIFNRDMAYLKALFMVHDGYREVTILDNNGDVEGRLIRRANGGLEVWTPYRCLTPESHDTEQHKCCCNKWKLSSFVGKLMPTCNAMRASTA